LIGDRLQGFRRWWKTRRTTWALSWRAGRWNNSLVQRHLPGRQRKSSPARTFVTSGLAAFFPRAFRWDRSWIRAPVEVRPLQPKRGVKLSANLGALEQVWVLFHERPQLHFNSGTPRSLAVFGEAAFPGLPTGWERS